MKLVLRPFESRYEFAFIPDAIGSAEVGDEHGVESEALFLGDPFRFAHFANSL